MTTPALSAANRRTGIEVHMLACQLSEASLRRVRAEFLEMPGLKLTVAQAQRLWGMDRATCEALIDELIARQFLTRARDGCVVRKAARV